MMTRCDTLTNLRPGAKSPSIRPGNTPPPTQPSAIARHTCIKSAALPCAIAMLHRASVTEPARRRRRCIRRRPRPVPRCSSGPAHSGSRRPPRRAAAVITPARAAPGRAWRTCSRCASPAWSAPRRPRPRMRSGTSPRRRPRRRPPSQVRDSGVFCESVPSPRSK